MSRPEWVVCLKGPGKRESLCGRTGELYMFADMREAKAHPRLVVCCNCRGMSGA